MAWSKLVDMELDDEDKLDACTPLPMPDRPKYPYGLRICLTHNELEKLGLEADCDIGDIIDLRAFAVVTSVSKGEGEYEGKYARVELQIEKLQVENESTEEK
jgi:hypothetical protein